MRAELISRKREFDGFFTLDRYTVRFERFSGEMEPDVSRLVFERGDSAAVILYDRRAQSVVLVEQFRLPALLREPGDGWLLEVVAGTIEASRASEEVARTEAVEEAGYSLDELEHVTTFYVSPGACSERIHLYVGYLSDAVHVGDGGGVGAGEDVRVVHLPLKRALEMVADGTIRDAKTIIALQHLAMTAHG